MSACLEAAISGSRIDTVAVVMLALARSGLGRTGLPYCKGACLVGDKNRHGTINRGPRPSGCSRLIDARQAHPYSKSMVFDCYGASSQRLCLLSTRHRWVQSELLTSSCFCPPFQAHRGIQGKAGGGYKRDAGGANECL